MLSLAASVAFGRQGPTQEPVPAPAVPQPATPSPTVPPAPGGASREAELEARVRQLEAMVNQLSGQIQRMAPAAPGDADADDGPVPPGSIPSGVPSTAGGSAPRGAAAPDTGTPAEVVAPSATGGAAAPGQSLPPNPPPSARFNQPATLDSVRANVKFGPGFEIRTNDDEYIFQFHNLTQVDYRGYLQGGQTPVHDTFDIPRQWFMFSGRITKPWGYFVSLANGFDVVSILDVFVDADYDPRLRLRLGRMKTPFTYEFITEPVQGLTVPERSIFFNNFAQNRDVGLMAFGRLFDNKFDYAVGIWNGTRNGFLAQNDAKKVSAYINYRPFGDEENTLFENLNIGGSVFAGRSTQLPIPQTLRTVVPTTGNAIIGVPFLGFNSNVRESGPLAFWDLHVAYFYKQWEIIGEWQSGFQNYALSSSIQNRTQVPVGSFYVQASYLLTGETRSGVGLVKPNQPFDLARNKRGPGAWEPFARYEYLDVGNQVFTAGLSDPNLWANRVWQTHVGINWWMTQYIKLTFDWTHAEFNNAVLFAPGRESRQSDMLWARFQLYF